MENQVSDLKYSLSQILNIRVFTNLERKSLNQIVLEFNLQGL